MTDQPYTNRELDHHFSEIKETLGRIEQQTIRTNGRVTKCEENILMGKTSARIANWAFGLTVPLIISMAIWIFFNQIQDIRHEINQHNEDYKNLLNNLK
jgi:hypothetical protein